MDKRLCPIFPRKASLRAPSGAEISLTNCKDSKRSPLSRGRGSLCRRLVQGLLRSILKTGANQAFSKMIQVISILIGNGLQVVRQGKINSIA